MHWIDQLGDWGDKLSPLLSSEDYKKLQKEIRLDSMHKIVYPAKEDVFKAFKLCQLKDVKIVILGQDPYHNGQATGLAFAKNAGKIPPSLLIIYRELTAQYGYVPESFDYSLEHWAQQGVLLLNTTLTVVKGQAFSHVHLWTWFTKRVVEIVCEQNPDVIFILWGKEAKSYKKFISSPNVLTAAHPAAELYSGGNSGFFGNYHFKKADEILKDKKIDWFEAPKKLSEKEILDMYL